MYEVLASAGGSIGTRHRACWYTVQCILQRNFTHRSSIWSSTTSTSYACAVHATPTWKPAPPAKSVHHIVGRPQCRTSTSICMHSQSNLMSLSRSNNLHDWGDRNHNNQTHTAREHNLGTYSYMHAGCTLHWSSTLCGCRTCMCRLGGKSLSGLRPVLLSPRARRYRAWLDCSRLGPRVVSVCGPSNRLSISAMQFNVLMLCIVLDKT